MAWFKWLFADLSPRRAGFNPRRIHVRFVVDEVALGQVFLRVIQFSSASIIRESLLSRLHLHVVLRRKTNGPSMGTFQKQCSFGKWAEFDRNVRAALSYAEVQSTLSYSCTSTPSYAFMAWCVIKQLDAIMFTITFILKSRSLSRNPNVSVLKLCFIVLNIYSAYLYIYFELKPLGLVLCHDGEDCQHARRGWCFLLQGYGRDHFANLGFPYSWYMFVVLHTEDYRLTVLIRTE